MGLVLLVVSALRFRKKADLRNKQALQVSTSNLQRQVSNGGGFTPSDYA